MPQSIPLRFKNSPHFPLRPALMYAIHTGSTLAKADHRQTAVTSRGKGNPMKDNTRHVPGSTPSHRPALSTAATHARRFHIRPGKCDHYASKMRPNFKTKISMALPSTTYNFTSQKWSHFANRGSSPLLEGEGQGEGQFGSSFSRASRPPSFSLGETVRMRDKLVSSARPGLPGDKFLNTIHNRRTRRFITDPITLYQRLTTIKIGVRRFFTRAIRWRPLSLSFGPRRRSLSPRAEPASVRVRDKLVNFRRRLSLGGHSAMAHLSGKNRNFTESGRASARGNAL